VFRSGDDIARFRIQLLTLIIFVGCIPDPADNPGKDVEPEVITTVDTSPKVITQFETSTDPTRSTISTASIINAH